MYVCLCGKMFYVLFILSANGNNDDDDGSLINDGTLINLSPKSRWSSVRSPILPNKQFNHLYFDEIK